MQVLPPVCMIYEHFTAYLKWMFVQMMMIR